MEQKVEISCKILDGIDEGRSCLDDEDFVYGSAMYVYEDEPCSEITGEINYKLCNFNKNEDMILNDKTRIRYNGSEVQIPDKYIRIQPDRCKVVSIVRQWNTCDLNVKKKSKTRPMSAILHARMKTSNGGYVHCHGT